MKLLPLLVLATTLSLGACANLIQSASISEAYKHYERQEYEQTLELIRRAKSAEEMSDEMKAELAYLESQTYRQLGNHDIAHTLYEYLVREHSNSQYGYLAAKHIE